MTLERLSACVDELRAGGSAGEQQAHQRRLLRELSAVARRWSPELLPLAQHGGGAAAARKPPSAAGGPLFALLLQALLVSYGGLAGGAGAGAGGNSAPMSMALSAAAPAASESVLSLICDLMVRAFDYAAVPLVNEALTGKHTPLSVRAALAVVVSRLPLSDAAPFFAEVVAFAGKSVKAADYFLKQRLVESVARVLGNDLPRLVALHPEALRIVHKTFQDKMPEVRLAAAGLLHVLALRTATGSSQSSAASSSSGGGGGANGSSALSSSGNGSSGGGGSSNGGSSSSGSNNSVTQEAIMYVGIKGLDDASPECRRAYAAVVGVVLAKFATSTPEGELPGDGGSSATRSHDEEETTRHSGDHDANGPGSGAKAKLAFKMSMVHLNLPGSLSRRKAAAVNFSTVASIIGYLREAVASRYLTANPNQSHGGILAAYSVALVSMFEHLPADTIAEHQFSEIIDSTLSVLDHPFSLGDLTRARNAVCYVLRFGLYPCLTERQQEALLGSYLHRLKEEAATAGDGHHHKLLSILVEISHMLQAMGEACVSHAQDGTTTLQGLLSHEKQSVRFQASVALASLVTALPYKLKSVLTSCISGLRATAEYLLQTAATHGALSDEQSGAEATNSRSLANLYIIQGRSSAVAHILRAIKLQRDGGLSHSVLTEILALSELLIESQFLEGCTDSVWLTCTRAGWTLVGSLVAVNDEHWVHSSAQKLLDLWLKSSVLHTRESSLELLRIEAAVVALNGFLTYCKDLTSQSDDLQMLAAYILNVFLSATQDRLSNPLKRRGQVARYRVITWIIKSFVLLPPIFSDSYIVLLDLIAEYTVAQSLTSLRQSPLVPAESTYLHNALAGADEPLEMASTPRLVAGDNPNVLYSRELNHILALLQLENALSDTELEVQYMDNFWGVVCEVDGVGDMSSRGICSSFTYVRLVDVSVFLFGRIFHFVPEDLQLRCLQHFASMLADGGRAGCEVNVASLLFAVLREAKDSRVGQPSAASVWPQQMQTMLNEMLASENARVRRSAGEALGMLASLVSEASCRSMVQEIEKRIATEKPPATLSASISAFGGSPEADPSIFTAGAAFALACIKRECGSRVSIDTGLIFRFAGDLSQPLRTWILHAWSIVLESASTSGGDYEQYIKSTLSLVDAHILAGFKHSKVNKKGLRWGVSAKVAIGRIINGVVAALGPDLASSGKRLREFYTTWSLLRQDGDLRVELEYLKFLEQVVVFAPARFQLADLLYILNIVSDAFVLTPSTSSSATGALPSPSTPSVRSPFAASSEPHVVLVHANGAARNVLQHVSLSCIRTLVERDPSLIARHSLQCLLFHALHVEYNALTWRYLPGVHGMWDFLTFKCVAPSATRGSSDEIRRTLLALVDVDAANAQDHELIVWSLLCRSIAVGESGASSGAGNAEELMMSPKGTIDLAGLSLSGASAGAADDEASWGFAKPSVQSTADKSLLAADATAAQVGVWRSTKRVVSDLVATLPPLSRQVRHFAVECVLRVIELVATSGQIDATLHFDLVAARQHFLRQLAVGDGAAKRAAGASSARTTTGNFVCMYLDEFVTLACHAATASADGSELQMFQSVGLRLLSVLVGKFAAARDPEVHSGDAFLLDPYQAQMTSAIRQALKQSQAAPGSESESDGGDLYAPLLVEAYEICGIALSSRLIQDKVALGRILKMVAVADFGHAHFIGDEATRVTLSLANLSCIAQMFVASVAQDDGRRSLAASPLVKVFLTTFAASSTYLIDCWKDATLSYGVLMRGTGWWPQIDDEDEFLPGGGVTSSKVLRTLLPVPTAASPSSSSSAERFREVFKHHWPPILSALVTAQTHLPSSFHGSADLASLSRLLASFCVFHINTSVRDRRDADDLIPAIRTTRLLLESIEEAEKKQSVAQSESEFADVFQSAVRALVNAALRATGAVRVEAVKTVFACLKRESIAYCASRVRGDPAGFYALVGQAALCPAEVFRQLCDPSKAAQASAAHLLDVLQCATTGVVLLHTTAELRSYTVHALGLAAQSFRSVHDRPEVHDAALALSRAVVESTVAFVKSLAPEEAAEQCEAIRAELRKSFSVFVRWYQEELVVARERSAVSGLDLVLRLVATTAVGYPAFLAADVASFHAAITAATAAILRVHLSDSEQRSSRFGAHLLRGLAGVARKLVDVQDAATARGYFAALGPLVVRLLDEFQRPLGGGASAAAAVAELEQAEELLRLLGSQLDDAFGAALVRLLLPRLAVVLQAQAAGESSAAVGAAVARLLLSFAQTRAAAFKEAAGAMDPTRRAALELALRSALTGGAQRAAESPAASAPGRPLDLSRYS